MILVRVAAAGNSSFVVESSSVLRPAGPGDQAISKKTQNPKLKITFGLGIIIAYDAHHTT